MNLTDAYWYLNDDNLQRFTLPQLAGLHFGEYEMVEADGHLTPRGWGLLSSILSSIVCFVLYKYTRTITSAIVPIYKKLSRTDQRNWDSRYSSNIHAVLCVYFAYYLVWNNDFFWREGPIPMILRTNAQTYIALGMSFGYFAVDFISTVKYNMGGTEMLLHHLGSLMSVTTALVTGDCHCHTLWMLVTEFTTPLINNRWWLDKMELKHSQLYVINGLAILVSWIFARMAVFPPFFYVVWKTRDQIFVITHLSKFLATVVPIILTVLNTYWFVKIVKGAYKVLFSAKKEAAKED